MGKTDIGLRMRGLSPRDAKRHRALYTGRGEGADAGFIIIHVMSPETPKGTRKVVEKARVNARDWLRYAQRFAIKYTVPRQLVDSHVEREKVDEEVARELAAETAEEVATPSTDEETSEA